jgi:Protein of unknown function (DUF2867)
VTSLAIDACPDPDVIDVQELPLPAGAGTDPRWWLRQVFHIRSMPLPVRLLFGLRQLVAGVIGADTSRTGSQVFAVDAADDREAMAVEQDRHLDFWVGVATDRGLLQVTTVVRLHGWRGRAYWLPVGVLHGPITRSIMRSAIRRYAGSDRTLRGSR